MSIASSSAIIANAPQNAQYMRCTRSLAMPTSMSNKIASAM